MTVEVIDNNRLQQQVAQRQRFVEAMEIQELNSDQRREAINSRQRYDAWRAASDKLHHFKGSMTWTRDGQADYLVRSYYEPATGLRRQKSLGPRSPETEKHKADFDKGRKEARHRVAELEEVLDRQASINRAIGLGRMPLLGARIVRALDGAGFLGNGVRIVGTNAIYAYEATAGVFVEAGMMTTEDIDLLFDARRQLRLAAARPISERNLLNTLRSVDRSFDRDKNTFRAVNRDGYLVDLIKPLPDPPWRKEAESFSEEPENDLIAAGLEGLEWLQNSPPFEAIVIDERGMPLRMQTPDPRAFAIHKSWVAERADRSALKRKRDSEQAMLVGQLVSRYLTHLPFNRRELSFIPEAAFGKSRRLFEAAPGAASP